MALGPTQPPVQWAPGLFPQGVKRQEGKIDHSPPSSAEVRNEWGYYPLIPHPPLPPPPHLPQALQSVVELVLL
jgi:hypothetical protein